MDNVMGSSPAFQKFSKFMMMGLAAITISNAVMAQPNVDTTSLSYTQQIEYVIKNSTEKGMLTKNMTVRVHQLGDNADKPSDYYMSLKADGDCEVNVSVDKHGDFDYFGSKENIKEFKDLVHPSTQQESQLYKELITLHEASHCEFSKIEKPFIIKGNSELQEKVNFTYTNSGGYYVVENGVNKVYTCVHQILNETFADTYGAMQLIKSHGATPDVLNTLSKFDLQRHEQGFITRAKMGVEEHDTHFSLAELLKPENIERVVKSNNPQELKQMALELSNASLGNLLVNTTMAKPLSTDTITSGVINIISAMKSQEESLQKGNTQETTGFNQFTTAENSLIFKIATGVIKEIKDNKIAGYNSASAEDKPEILFNHVIDIVDSPNQIIVNTSIEFRDYIKANFQKQDLEVVNSTTSKEQIAEKLSTIKNEFINKKSDTLSMMQKLRSNAFDNSRVNAPVTP
jgi:hypothetical protein